MTSLRKIKWIIENERGNTVSFIAHLRKLYKIQNKILLCYRPDNKATWSDRCLFLEDGYEPKKPYNHRSILIPEIVIEYDDPDPKVNEKLATSVTKKLDEDGIVWSKWHSGNKSYHVHFFITRTDDVKNLSLLKKTVIRYYTQFLPVPDLRLASDNHLVRAEYGIHEKTQRKKRKIREIAGYPKLSKLPQQVWDLYVKAQEKSINIRMGQRFTTNLKELDGFKFIVKADKFRTSDDGRERALFMLIHTLKHSYKDKKQELIKFLQEWYKYSGGHKLSECDIERKVRYHWNRNYRIGVTYLNELLESIGREDLIK